MLSQSTPRAPHRGNRFLPTVENLEDRRVPTVTVGQGPGTPVLLISAMGRRDVIRIRDRGNNRGGAITITGTGHPAPFASPGVAPRQKVVIYLFTRSSAGLSAQNLGNPGLGAPFGTGPSYGSMPSPVFNGASNPDLLF